MEYIDGEELLTKINMDFMLKTLNYIKVFEDGTEIECKMKKSKKRCRLGVVILNRLFYCSFTDGKMYVDMVE